MKKSSERNIIEIVATTAIMLVLATSYIGRNESMIGKTVNEIVRLAGEKHDYQLAQRLYAGSVLGVTTNDDSLEMMIYPEKKIANEISRLEALAAQYPTYPPLLSQLAKLCRFNGNEETAVRYEKELVRLRVTY